MITPYVLSENSMLSQEESKFAKINETEYSTLNKNTRVDYVDKSDDEITAAQSVF